MVDAAEQAREVTEDSVDGYAHEHRPLAGYGAMVGAFGLAFAGSLAAVHRKRGSLPAPGVWDLVLVGAATHKVSRVISKDRVMSFARAPFVRYEEPDGHGEVSEQPRGTGLRLAIGELIVCPYCLGQWVAAAFGVGLAGAPDLTRLVAFIFTAETAADFLQLAYVAAEEAAS
jgi:hypothetical protein